LAQLGRAELALAEGDAVLAEELASRYLRRIPPTDRVERAPGLEMFAYAALALGDAAAAAEAGAELAAIAESTRVGSLRASACFVRGLVAAAEGNPDAARSSLEDAVDLYAREGAPFETARARVELGRVLMALERPDAAAREWRRSRAAFETIGAEAAASR